MIIVFLVCARLWEVMEIMIVKVDMGLGQKVVRKGMSEDMTIV